MFYKCAGSYELSKDNGGEQCFRIGSFLKRVVSLALLQLILKVKSFNLAVSLFHLQSENTMFSYLVGNDTFKKCYEELKEFLYKEMITLVDKPSGRKKRCFLA